MKFNYQGQPYEFPEDATLDEIHEAIGYKPQQQQQQPPQQAAPQQQNVEAFKNAIGADRSPLNALQDVGAGVARGAQNVAATLGEAGQGIGSLAMRHPLMQKFANTIQKATGISVPDVDVREELGLGKKNPVDLGSLLASKNPNALLVGGGQLLPVFGSGGLVKNALRAGAYGATQADPGEHPIRNRLLSGLREAGTVYGLGKLIPAVYQGAKNAINYLRPGKASEQFINKLGQGVPVDVNAERIAEGVNLAAKAKKAEALAHKEKVLGEIGHTNVAELPGFNLEKVAKVFEQDVREIDPSKIKSLERAIKDYRKDENLDKFISKSENIFETSLPESKIDKLEDLISSRRTKYETNEGSFSEFDKNLRKVHEKFIKDKSLNNADRLIRELNDRIFKYKALGKKIHPTDAEKLKDLTGVKKDLLKDMETHMKSQTPALQNEYKTYRTKWATQVEPYYSKPSLAKMAQGETQGTKESQVRAAFAYPTKEVNTILTHIPQIGKNQILYNELTAIKPKNALALSKKLHSLYQDKGYSKYFTPEMRNFMTRLDKQISARNVFNKGAKIAGGAALATGAYGTYKHFKKPDPLEGY